MTLGIRRMVLALVILGSVATVYASQVLVGEVQSAQACSPDEPDC